MSSQTPTMGATSQTHHAQATGGSEPSSSRLLAASFALEPSRFSLVSWTVRMAQAVDRIIAHAVPATLLPQDHAKRLIETTLKGLDRCCRLIPAHHDVVVFERARLQVQQVLETRRERHRRFLQCRQFMAGETFNVDESYLHLNPVCRWIRMTEEPTQSDPDCHSGSVLFFLADHQVHGLRMNLEGQVLINELADYQPCTVVQWARISSLGNLQQLELLAQQLADIGLVAWCRPQASLSAA